MPQIHNEGDGGSPWSESIYGHLHQIAERALAREAPGNSLQPTLLVNDAWLKLEKQENLAANDRAAVLAAGANIIRRLLIDYARLRKSAKRGGTGGRGVPLEISVAESGNLDLLELNDALESLTRESSRAAKVVELKFFGGLSAEEIAEQLQVSLRTVTNDWRFAKAWLYRILNDYSKVEDGDE